MVEDNPYVGPVIYKELKGRTREERATECPPGYWCYQPSRDDLTPEEKDTEVWADRHGMYCPVCRVSAVDTGPWPRFMCPDCGLTFELEMFPSSVIGHKVVLVRLSPEHHQ